MTTQPERAATSEVVTELADDLARATRRFVEGVQQVASGERPEEAVSRLLLELSALLAVGAALGALVDVTPEERFEPDAGYEVDVDRLRQRLRDLLEAADAYAEVFDPYAPGEPVPCRLSDDLADICTDLLHGLSHHLSGRAVEAVWWWQFSYLSTWGPAAARALRALQALVAHVRLGVPIDASPAAEDDLDPLDTTAAIEALLLTD